MQARGLSLRELAIELGISEGTVRNAIVFATAADLRNGYARAFNLDVADAEIAALTVRQARMYVRLPAPVRDEWLDAGGDLKMLFKAVTVRLESPPRSRKVCLDGPDVDADFWQELVDAGLAGRVTAPDFVDSAHEAFRLLFFRKEHQGHVHNLDAYLRSVAEHHAPSDVLGYLPCRTRDQRTEVLISPEQWTQILTNCEARAADRGELIALIRVGLQVAVEDAGIQEEEVADPRAVLARRAVGRAPSFLRDSKISLQDKHAFTVLLQRPDVAADMRLEAVGRACQMLEELSHAAHAGPSEGGAPRLSRALVQLLVEPTPMRAFDLAVEEVAQRRLEAKRRETLADATQLVEALATHLGVENERRQLLLTRLRQVPAAELRLLGAAAMRWPVDLGGWIDEVQGRTEASGSFEDRA
jgi:hypothetical protein